MSVVSLGARRESQGLLDLLGDCHGRIRAFSAMAVELAASDAPADQARDAARAIARYFREALPLHVADEEQSIAPRLHDVADALLGMAHEHAAHAPLIANVIALCDAIAADPALRATLAPAAAALTDAMEHHLAAEERDIFPAIAALPAADQAAIVAELRNRRTSATPVPPGGQVHGS